MNTRYATCYICDELVYLFKKTFSSMSPSAAAFYQRHMAIVKNGIVLCPRCSSNDSIPIYPYRGQQHARKSR
ncbi:Mv-ORF31 peptide [Maruca vitrata nucleopolyhedrovirus]|uniref:Mv-ORF31 peptide n=1 Tax=Maruca vitrata nucleopolyhedrovirus TaxID=1307954 RepID=A1YR93_9ABAC|nr:Mv-ORF31 peptide [Maruca vitrata nucleopolyhedrovirus]ABL75983.1 Mv-ORF31 peptide [Maruca vitrata nucleopolyhedrovirus]